MDKSIIENLGLSLYQDTFSALNESSFNYEDSSKLKIESFDKKRMLEFITDPTKVNTSYSSNEVLGIMEGIFFMPGGYSRNKRFYSEKLWSNTLESSVTKSKLSSGSMFGMFEHPMVNSMETKDGLHTSSHYKYSGIVTKQLKIVESSGRKIGYGKAYILNTPIGNILNVMLKAKDENGQPLIKLAVSSRAYAKTSGTDKQGNDIIDENNYYLDSFDVVVNPGIAEAFPEYKSLVESVVNYFCKGDDCACERQNLIKELGLKSIN